MQDTVTPEMHGRAFGFERTMDDVLGRHRACCGTMHLSVNPIPNKPSTSQEHQRQLSHQTIAVGGYSGTQQRNIDCIKPHGTWLHEHTVESRENGALMEDLVQQAVEGRALTNKFF